MTQPLLHPMHREMPSLVLFCWNDSLFLDALTQSVSVSHSHSFLLAGRVTFFSNLDFYYYQNEPLFNF
jgi:hypothetical protein